MKVAEGNLVPVDTSCIVQIVRLSSKTPKRIKYREKHFGFVQGKCVGVQRSILASTFDERDPEFTEEVEAESRRQAWVLHRELYGAVSKDRIFVQDSRPFEAVRGHTAPRAKYR